jgi:hypothetical protein
MARTKLRVMSDKDRKEIVRLFKRKRTPEDVHAKFRRYNRYQIGAVKQHLTKGDYAHA